MKSIIMTTLKPTTSKQPTILREDFPYRYVITGTIELNGKPDCRIQVFNTRSKRYNDMYLCDNEMQMMAAMEDKDYTLWLAGEPCYRKDTSRRYY